MKKIIVLFLFVFFSLTTFSQQSFEFGVGAGLSSYFGDLKPELFRLNQNSFSLNLSGRYNLNSRFAARVGLGYYAIRAEDSKSGQLDLIKRNLSFKSNIFEASFIGEFNILNFANHPLNYSDKKYFKLTPYLFGGVALFGFNPKAKFDGEWYELQPLGTEGQNIAGSGKEPYKLVQLSIPVGFGIKYQLKDNLILSYELGWRKTFTDYLDDVSGTYHNLNELGSVSGNIAGQLAFRGDELDTYNGFIPITGTRRGNPENMDWYFVSNITVTYKLLKE